MPALKQGGNADRLTPYFREVRRTHPLSREEERRLASRIRKGDIEARNRLATANLRFALNVARRYEGRGLPLDELICAANMGLLEAANRFDGQSGVRFITYAVWWIRRYVLKALDQEHHLVHVPGHILDMQHKIHRASRELLQDLERPPRVEEIASRLEEPVQAVGHAVSSNQIVRSLDEEVETFLEGEYRFIDRFKVPEGSQQPDTLDRLGREEEVHQLMEHLTGSEAEVVRRHYGLDGAGGDNLAAVGRSLGLSRERVRQIRSSALRRMRQQHQNRESRPREREKNGVQLANHSLGQDRSVEEVAD